jgi:hypothetical protein
LTCVVVVKCRQLALCKADQFNSSAAWWWRWKMPGPPATPRALTLRCDEHPRPLVAQ